MTIVRCQAPAKVDRTQVPVLDVKNQFVEPWKKLEAEAVEHIEGG
jgi:hypothetical protein